MKTDSFSMHLVLTNKILDSCPFNYFAICKSPIIRLICPSKYCISIVFNFSWDGCNTQEKCKTKVMKNFGASKVHYGRSASGECLPYGSIIGYIISESIYGLFVFLLCRSPFVFVCLL